MSDIGMFKKYWLKYRITFHKPPGRQLEGRICQGGRVMEAARSLKFDQVNPLHHLGIRWLPEDEDEDEDDRHLKSLLLLGRDCQLLRSSLICSGVPSSWLFVDFYNEHFHDDRRFVRKTFRPETDRPKITKNHRQYHKPLTIKNHQKPPKPQPKNFQKPLKINKNHKNHQKLPKICKKKTYKTTKNRPETIKNLLLSPPYTTKNHSQTTKTTGKPPSGRNVFWMKCPSGQKVC